jgi:hypothetical protein
MKHFKWLYGACIFGYYIFGVIATYVVPVSYDAWVSATCITIFIIIGLSLYSEHKTKQQKENQ